MAKRIRRATRADGAALARIYEPYVTEHATSFEMQPPDAGEMSRRVEALEATYPWIVFERDGRVSGYAYASGHQPRAAYRWAANVTVYIEEADHRAGIGRALYTALFDLLRRQHFVTLIAGITLPNANSVGLHEAMGFRMAGVFPRVGFKMGMWHDVAWLHLPLTPGSEAPADLLPTSELWRDPDVERLFAATAATVRD
jgi:phosphinothricin acetyltransferase